jgi:hypothetical protein
MSFLCTLHLLFVATEKADQINKTWGFNKIIIYNSITVKKSIFLCFVKFISFFAYRNQRGVNFFNNFEEKSYNINFCKMVNEQETLKNSKSHL